MEWLWNLVLIVALAALAYTIVYLAIVGILGIGEAIKRLRKK